MHAPLRTTMGRGFAHGERVDGVWSPRRPRCDVVLRRGATGLVAGMAATFRLPGEVLQRLRVARVRPIK